MQSHEPLRALAAGHQLSDGKRRSIGGKDGIALHDGIERAEGLALLFQVLDDGFDNKVTLGQVFFASGALQAGADRCRCFLDGPFFRQLGQRLLDAGKTFIKERLLSLKDNCFQSGRRADLRDAGTHQTAA